MMKQNFYNLCMLATLLLMLLSVAICGCEDVRVPAWDTPDPALPDVTLPLGISSLAATSGGSDPATANRAATPRVATTPLNTNTSIGFYVKLPVVTPGSSDLTYEEKGNYYGAYNTQKNCWAPANGNIWLSNRDAVMTVYAPYSSAQPADRINLTAALLKDDNSNDLLAATMNVNSLSVARGVSVVLSHLYTCLQFTFIKNDNFAPYEIKIKQIELAGGDLYAAGTYHPYTQAYTGTTPRADVSLVVNNLLVPTTGQVSGGTPAAIIKTLLVPVRQVFADDVTLRVTTLATASANSRQMSVKIPKTTFTGLQPFAPGMQYNFRIKVSPTQEMELVSVAVENWETGVTVNDDLLLD